jgi:tRNA-splicing ligase RtcB (3'-phosphate/5'-hydroxy nucleic acid ligase)
MPYDSLNLSTQTPVLSWAKHDLGHEEEKMARNVASLPFVFKHVALMPDVHLGKGALVGSVIATKETIIPAAVGVDIGCFTGDTLIPLVDGKTYSIKELANLGKTIYVYSCTDTGRIVASEAIARLTRHNAPLVKVVLDNGEEIKCTPDHQFMLRDGSYIEASNLTPETSLMPFYSSTDKDGYTLIQQNYSGRLQKAHWVVARSGRLDKIPSFEGQKTVIARKNFEKQYQHGYNHKVVAVIPLPECEDVYCLSVPEYNNFALSAGVFVHNCGMAAIKMPFKGDRIEDKLKKIRLDIEAAIPVGFSENKEITKDVDNWQGWHSFKDLHRGVQDLKGKAIKQLGSLGGGKRLPLTVAIQ